MTLTQTTPYPFPFTTNPTNQPTTKGAPRDETLTLKNVRGKIPSIQASTLRTMMLEAHSDPTKIIAHACSYDGLSSRLVQEAGFPIVFLAGYAVASSYGLPDTGYIAMAEMCDKIQEAVRATDIPVMADGDTGYGSPMNVKRTVESFAAAGAAGIMIEDQTWPKRMFPFPFPFVSLLFCGGWSGMDGMYRETNGISRMRPHKRQIRCVARRSLRPGPSSR